MSKETELYKSIIKKQDKRHTYQFWVIIVLIIMLVATGCIIAGWVWRSFDMTARSADIDISQATLQVTVDGKTLQGGEVWK